MKDMLQLLKQFKFIKTINIIFKLTIKLNHNVLIKV